MQELGERARRLLEATREAGTPRKPEPLRAVATNGGRVIQCIGGVVQINEPPDPPGAQGAAPSGKARAFQFQRVWAGYTLTFFVAFLWWAGLFELDPGENVLQHAWTWVNALSRDQLLAGMLGSFVGAFAASYATWMFWRGWAS